MYIDPHVHLRDFNQAYKETVQHGLLVARDSGVDAVFDMPNTNPAILAREQVQQRLHLVHQANVPEVFYGLYVGLTRDVEQIKQAVELHREFEPVVGLKLFAGHSVGNLSVVETEDQARVYHTLTAEGFDGVLAVHAEKESELHPEWWNPVEPITHCHARPEPAEIASVHDQLALASNAAFTGKLHIAHISSPIAVQAVLNAKAAGLNVSCGATPHHLIFDCHQMTRPDGILWKTNPPLRSSESRKGLLQCLLAGQIDWIETDHAPHTLAEKTHPPYLSGLPGLAWWNFFEQYLRQVGCSEELLNSLLFENARQRFNLNIPKSRRPLIDRRADYAFNPYQDVESNQG